MTKVLILTANPTNTKPLRLSEEVREIKTALKQSDAREQFTIVVEEAVHPKELRRTLLDHKPDIVHFSGHGGGEQGLALLGKNNEAHLIKPDALTRFFKALADIFHIECVLLNACYSEVQANGIQPYVDNVVGMSQKIGDQAAQQFAIGFYDTVFAGESIESAFALGCNAIEMENIPEHLTPVLKQKHQDEIQQETTSQDVEMDLTPPPSPEVARQVDIPFENLDGQVPLGSPFYVKRPPIEGNCYDAIQKKAGLIRVKAPRQMGKTSLMSRVLCEGERLGYRKAFLNRWERRSLQNIDVFLESFCARLSKELGVEERIDKYWKKRLGSQDNCSNYLQEYLLEESDAPIVLGLDEIDQIFEYQEIADEFFGLLRSWHELGKNDEIWQRLRLIISHSQEVYIPLNVNRSPFNVGLPIELGEFSFGQVKDLVERHGLEWRDERIHDLITMVGGHPYLVRMALYHLASGQLSWSEFLEIAPTEEGLYEDHLFRHLLVLEENPDLEAAMLELVQSREPVRVKATCSFKLKSIGLAKSKGNKLVPLCELYRQYFGDRLID